MLDDGTQDTAFAQPIYSTQVPMFHNIITEHNHALVTFWQVPQHEEAEMAICEQLQMP
jgi:hypothetical protein